MSTGHSKQSRAWCVLAATMVCGQADAHLNSTGMGPVYDGLLHFLTSPADLVPVLALALLAGLRGAAFGRRAMFALPAAWLLGIALGATAAASDGGPYWISAWLLVMGALVVIDAKLPLWALTALCALMGLTHGYLNGTGLGLSVTALVAGLGIAAAVFLLVVLVAAFVVSLRAHWARIAVRVGGSWIAASGLLMLGWALRGI